MRWSRHDQAAGLRAAARASQLGLALGAVIGEHFRERAEQAAAVALILLGCYLIAERAFA